METVWTEAEQIDLHTYCLPFSRDITLWEGISETDT